MAVDALRKELIAVRRERVAALRVQGYTLRQITGAMADPNNPHYMVNPETGNPYDLATIQRDSKANLNAAKRQALGNTKLHIASQYQDLQALKEICWRDGRYKLLLDVLKREADLLGLDQPTKTDITSDGKALTSDLAGRLEQLVNRASGAASAGDAQGNPE